MAPYQKTNAFVALAFAGATVSSLRSRRACRAEAAEQRRLVGLGRLELPTSRLSSARSNQLSYKPQAQASPCARPTPPEPFRSERRARHQGHSPKRRQETARARPGRKRNEG